MSTDFAKTVEVMHNFRAIIAGTKNKNTFVSSFVILIAELYDILLMETFKTAIGVLIAIFLILWLTSNLTSSLFVIVMIVMIDACVFGFL